MTTQSIETRRTATFTKATDTVLINALTIHRTKAQADRTAEDRQVHAWIVDELARRFPAAAKVVEQAMNDAFDHEERTGEYMHVDYAAVLLAAIAAN